MAGPKWTEARIALAVKLWNEGWTGADVAAAVGANPRGFRSFRERHPHLFSSGIPRKRGRPQQQSAETKRKMKAAELERRNRKFLALLRQHHGGEARP